jgi:hypothetical protein
MRDPDDFAYLDTTTPGKLEMIRTQTWFITERMKWRPRPGSRCIGLPGSAMQADRHRDEYLGYGFAEEDQIMVDRSNLVHQGHQAWKARSGYKGTVRGGWIEDAIEREIKDGHTIDLIDYDDVANLEPRHEEMVRRAAELGVRAIIMVLCTRCSTITSYQQDWQDRLGIDDEISANYGRPGRKMYSTPLGKIQEEALMHVGKELGYLVGAWRYRGLSSMQSVVMLKN